MYGYKVECAKPYDDLSTVQLLMAHCRASRVDLMCFGGLAAPLRDVVMQSISRHAPLVYVRKLNFNGLPLAADVPNDRFLTTLKSFAEIKVLIPPKARTPEEKASVENFCKNRGIQLENALYSL
ncbi:hypothetical protein AAVH_11329 [Aphelenchoides avenae]|nr:hypothetical protein AAVH_11329 [Aphelenchus avenae]